MKMMFPHKSERKRKRDAIFCALRRREAPSGGVSGGGVSEAGFLGRVLRVRRNAKTQNPQIKKFARNNKMQKFTKSQHKGGKMQKSKRKIKKNEVESEK